MSSQQLLIETLNLKFQYFSERLKYWLACNPTEVIISKHLSTKTFSTCYPWEPSQNWRIEIVKFHLKTNRFNFNKKPEMFKCNVTNILVLADHRMKRNAIWDSGLLLDHIWATFDFFFFFGHFGVIRCTKMACDSKMVGCKKGSQMDWNLGFGLVEHIWCIFDFIVFKVIWESFGTVISKWYVTQERLILEWNGVKFAGGRVVVQHIWGSFDLILFKVI